MRRSKPEKAILLFLEMVSMFPAGRAGGILARAMLPMMVAGAALSSIKGEGAALTSGPEIFFAVWVTCSRTGGRVHIVAWRQAWARDQGKRATVVAATAAQSAGQGYVIKGFDPKGLQVTNKERGLYQQGAQGYLKLEGQYVKTAVQQGERIIYAPNNRADSRRVNWEDGRWHLQQHAGLRGRAWSERGGWSFCRYEIDPLTVTCARQSLMQGRRRPSKSCPHHG